VKLGSGISQAVRNLCRPEFQVSRTPVLACDPGSPSRPVRRVRPIGRSEVSAGFAGRQAEVS